MDKQEIINGLESLTNRLVVDVTKAFEDRGDEFGEQRYIAWRKKLYAFFKQNLPQSINDFNALFSPYEIFQPDYLETHLDFFIRSKGNKIFSFLESLKLDLENDEYDFTPINKEVKSVETAKTTPAEKSKKVFIVHGHDSEVRSNIESFLWRHSFEPIILQFQASRNKTIIEKLEHHTKDVGFAIVLYTPDDLGQVKAKASNGELGNRARQNVVFEHGFLMGLIGRENVVTFVKGDIELPNDISGIVYIDEASWELSLIRELRAAEYDIDSAKI